MKLNQFRYLVAISQFGSISGAARALYTSQPAVSMAVKELEDEFGFPILLRTRQGVTFSPGGKQILELSKVIVTELDKLEQLKVHRSDGALSGTLSIGGTSYFSDSLLLNVILEMHSAYPALTIRLEEDNSQSILDKLRSGSINLGVIIHCNIDEFIFQSKMNDFGLHAVPLFEDEMCFVVGEKHPLYGQEQAPLAEILRYPVVQYKAASNEQTLKLFHQYRTDLDLLYIDDFKSLWRLPELSSYAILSPTLAVPQHNSPLKVLRIADFRYTCTVSYVHNSSELTEAESEIVYRLKRAVGKLTAPQDS